MGPGLEHRHRRAGLQALARAAALRPDRDAVELVARGHQLRLPISHLTWDAVAASAPKGRARVPRARRDARRARRRAPRRQRSTPGAAPPPPRSPRRAGRPSASERPPAPWGSFPLSELVILLGIVVLLWGFLSGSEQGGADRRRARARLAGWWRAGAARAPRRLSSHSALLAGVRLCGDHRTRAWPRAGEAMAARPGRLAVFGPAFYGLRELFKRRSGGLGFR